MRYRSLSAIVQPGADELRASADVVSTPQASIHDPGFGDERVARAPGRDTCSVVVITVTGSDRSGASPIVSEAVVNDASGEAAGIAPVVEEL